MFWLHLQVRKLKAQLDQKTQKNGTENSSSPDGEVLENGTDPNIIELQSTNPFTRKTDQQVNFTASFVQQLKNIFAQSFPGDSNRQISDMKFKLVKAEQEVTALEQNVS